MARPSAHKAMAIAMKPSHPGVRLEVGVPFVTLSPEAVEAAAPMGSSLDLAASGVPAGEVSGMRPMVAFAGYSDNSALLVLPSWDEPR
ncbi:MAG: hypothetical protein K2Q25_04565 [Mycobacteriaceae bacterium]|nr:hypothetical protein [Mycobacteriaceae bacterium]